LTLVVALAASAMLSAGLVVADADAHARSTERWVRFVTEDRNIECETSTFQAFNIVLECVMHSSGYDGIEDHYHPHWVLQPNGAASQGPTPRVLGGGRARVLHDEQTLTIGSFRCSASHGSHLTCVARFAHGGFFLSRGRQRIW
jgi:hypothetical protein